MKVFCSDGMETAMKHKQTALRRKQTSVVKIFQWP